MARRLYLSGKYKKRYVIVDDEDYEAVKDKHFYACQNIVRGRGEKRKKYCYPWRGYVYTPVTVFDKRYFHTLHSIITERKYGYKCPEGFQIDHINGNPKDNRRCNLHYIPREENVRKTMLSGKGYHFEQSSQRWIVKVTKTDPFTKKVRKKHIWSTTSKNEARLVAYLYKQGYTIPRKRRKHNVRH